MWYSMPQSGEATWSLRQFSTVVRIGYGACTGRAPGVNRGLGPLQFRARETGQNNPLAWPEFGARWYHLADRVTSALAIFVQEFLACGSVSHRWSQSC
jgi:hypothetical protein